MKDLVTKLKSFKKLTKTQFDETIKEYAYNQLLDDLKEAGLTKEDMEESEFNAMLEQKIKEAKSFSKGALMAGGAFLFLELIG